MIAQSATVADLFPVLEQARVFYVQHAPARLVDETVPAAILCLLLGIGVSVLGARFARFAATLAFAGLGAGVGHLFARESGFPSPLCVAGGALLVGTVAYQTFRMWVGVATAVFLASVSLGVFGYERVLPHVAAFQDTTAQAYTSPEAMFAPPTPSEQEAYLRRTPDQWVAEFWAFLKQQDKNIEPNVRSLTLAALLTGLCIGVVAMRWSLILVTSLLGTAFVATGLGTLLGVAAKDQFYQAFEQHPGVVGLAVGGFLLTSLILQTMLTRAAPAKGPKTKPGT